MQWFTYDQIIHFHLKCEQVFFNSPGWYLKIVQRIIDITDYETDSAKIVDALTPMFRGNQSLVNLFRRLFPDLPPPT